MNTGTVNVELLCNLGRSPSVGTEQETLKTQSHARGFIALSRLPQIQKFTLQTGTGFYEKSDVTSLFRATGCVSLGRNERTRQ